MVVWGFGVLRAVLSIRMCVVVSCGVCRRGDVERAGPTVVYGGRDLYGSGQSAALVWGFSVRMDVGGSCVWRFAYVESLMWV